MAAFDNSDWKVYESKIGQWTGATAFTGTTSNTTGTSWYYYPPQMINNTGPIMPKMDLDKWNNPFDEPDEPMDEMDYGIDVDGDCACPTCQQEKNAYQGGNQVEELSFVMYKPDAFERGLVGELMQIVDSKGVRLVGAKVLTMTEDQVAHHYSHHVGKTFFPDMVDFYTSGPTMACVYKGVHANNAIRQLIGSKHPSESPPGSIRGKYATSFPKNLIHGSDSAGDAAHEMPHFFSSKEIAEFKKA